MKRISIVCSVLLLILSLSAHSQERGFAYSIERDDKAGYLFGTFHLGGLMSYPLRAELESIIGAAKCVAVEIRPDDSTLKTVLEKARLPPGRKLSDVIAPQTSERLRILLSKYGYPSSTAQDARPWLAANSLPFFIMPRIANSRPPTVGLDGYLLGKAAQKGATVYNLETVAEQYSFVELLKAEEEEAVLIEVLEWLELTAQGQETLSEKMGGVFRRGDIGELLKTLTDHERHIAHLTAANRKIIYLRNKNQADRINEMMQSGKQCVFAIGAAHLGGSDGVIERLKGRSYKIKQL